MNLRLYTGTCNQNQGQWEHLKKKDDLVSKKLSIFFLSLCLLIYKIGLEKNMNFENEKTKTRNNIHKVKKAKRLPLNIWNNLIKNL